MKKLIKRLIAAVIIIPIVLVVGVFYYIDAIAKAGVEHGATYALGVPTTLDSISVGVITGKLSMEELNVSNPPGFGDDSFLSLGEGRVAVTLGSLMEDTVELPELRLTKVQMNLEKKGDSSNYQTILKGLDKFESKDNPAAKPTEDAKKFVVRLVSVEDINVSVDMLGLAGGLTKVPLHIDKIELRDVGSESDGGVLMAELTDILVKAILEAVVRHGGSAIPNAIALELSSGLATLDGLGQASLKVVGDVTTMVNGEVKQVGELGGAILDDLGKTAGGLSKSAEEVTKGASDVVGEVGKIGEGLGGLLGGKKSDKKDAKDPKDDDQR
ncbi:MAG: hypothetical protein H6817_05000 [Phycisphaerales bacterium]|nr:hypothetical protein [Phycisphaerales bacterium]